MVHCAATLPNALITSCGAVWWVGINAIGTSVATLQIARSLPTMVPIALICSNHSHYADRVDPYLGRYAPPGDQRDPYQLLVATDQPDPYLRSYTSRDLYRSCTT